MYPHHVFDLEPAGTFGMYLICYRRVSGRYFQPEPAMYSRCFCWFPGPLAPSESPLSVSSSRNEEGDYLVSCWVMTPPQRRSVLPFVKTLDLAQEPTHGQLDDWTTTVLSEDRRSDDRMLHVGHSRSSVCLR